MNNDNACSAAETAERNLINWENFVRAYCRANKREYEEVMKDSVLVEMLNVQWLRTKDRLGAKPQPGPNR